MKRKGNNSLLIVLVIILLLAYPPAIKSGPVYPPAYSSATMGKVALKVLKTGIKTFLFSAAKKGINKAGPEIFDKTWRYAKEPVLSMVEEICSLIPGFLSKDKTREEKTQQVQTASNFVDNDHYMDILLINSFSELPKEHYNQVLMTLTHSVYHQMDKSLQNQSLILQRQLLSLQNQQVMMDMLRLLTRSQNAMIEGISHCIDPGNIMEFDYPDELGFYKNFALNDRYGYIVGNTRAGEDILGTGNFFDMLSAIKDPNYYIINIMDLKEENQTKTTDSQNNNPRENYTKWKENMLSIKVGMEDIYNNMRVIDERLDPYPAPERKYFLVTRSSLMGQKSFHIYFFKGGSSLNTIFVHGSFDRKTWEKYGNQIKKCIYSGIIWSPFQAEKYFKGL